MDKVSPDNFEWSQHLGCPLVANFQEHEKTMLNYGVVSFAWDEISSRSLPIDNALESRKNILLYYLKSKMKIMSIEHAHNIKRLKTERKKINERLEHIENECENIYESTKPKSSRITQVKSLKQLTKVKKMIIHSKHEEIKRDISACNELLLEYRNLQPSENKIINETIMFKSVALVGTISCRQDKREIWQQISENLGNISISELWKWLLNKRIQDTNKVTRLELLSSVKKENAVDIIKKEEKPVEKKEKKINVYQHNNELAKVYGKHILNAIDTVIYFNKAKEYQNYGVDYIEKIFLSAEREVINDWLELILQIPQLEKRRIILKHHINDLDNINKDEENLPTQHNQLSCHLHETEVNMNECIQKFQNSLVRLKPGGQFLYQIKNHLMVSLNTISNLLHSDNDVERLNININTEIDEFYKNFNINASNKVMLMNMKNPYRHASKCMSNALLTLPTTSNSVPVYHVPIYNIIDCFKNLSINALLKQRKYELNIIEKLIAAASKDIAPISTMVNTNIDILELLDNVNCLSEKCHKELELLDSLYNVWAYQPIQSVMDIMENVVFKTTFGEWIKRYTTLIYMIQRNNK